MRIYFKTKLLIGLCACIILGCSDDNESFGPPPIDNKSQTAIYPLPPSQWIGETNPYYASGYVGDVMPYFDNGKFHLFFLHDAKSKPGGEGFHDIHSFETSNLTTFEYQGRMIPYGLGNEPDFAIGTGSVVKVGSTYYFYYTGHNGNTPFVQNNPRESVLCATSTDLKNWTKVPDFKLTAPAGYYNYDFRDPHVFYNEEDGKYWMLMSTQTDSDRKAVVLLLTTDDPATNSWTSQGPIYQTTPQENYLMLECADMFKMGSYWYLIFSENWSDFTGTRYRMATSPNGPWTTPDVDRFDGEYLYAAKTASNGNQRYLFGWTARKAPENNTGNKEWAGNLVTHELVQNSDGTLAIKQPEGIDGLFKKGISLETENISGSVTENGDTYVLNGASAVATFSKLKKSNQINFTLDVQGSGDAGLLFNHNLGTNTAFKLAFEPSNNRVAAYVVNNDNAQYVNHINFQFAAGKSYAITITTNEDVCVVYIDNQIAFSNRIYDINGNNWSIFNNSATATFSNISLKNIN